MRSGLRPIHSVDTITCTSEISGTASSGVRVIAHTPHNVRTTVPTNTRNLLDVHQSIVRSIILFSVAGAHPRDLYLATFGRSAMVAAISASVVYLAVNVSF